MGATAKFKVGDRVLVTADEDGEGAGKTAVIIHVCSPLWAHVRFEQPIDGWGEGGQEWGVGVEKLKLVPAPPATLTIESGKFYRTRNGQKVGPAEKYGSTSSIYPNCRWVIGRVLYQDDGTFANGGQRSDYDLISEWVDESSAAATVPASNDSGTAGYTVPLCAFEGASATLHVGDGSSWMQVAGNQPAIVCLIENGRPKPSDLPHVHRNKFAAGKEAKRLAKKHPGKRFGVYEYVQHAEVVKPVYKHEWQRLAADGQKIAAIKALREVASLDLVTAKLAVEVFVDKAEHMRAA